MSKRVQHILLLSYLRTGNFSEFDEESKYSKGKMEDIFSERWTSSLSIEEERCRIFRCEDVKNSSLKTFLMLNLESFSSS